MRDGADEPRPTAGSGSAAAIDDDMLLVVRASSDRRDERLTSPSPPTAAPSSRDPRSTLGTPPRARTCSTRGACAAVGGVTHGSAGRLASTDDRK